MSLSDKFKKLIRPGKSKKSSNVSQAVLKSDKKIEPIKKVEFNIPIDAYNLMSEVENNFNYFYSKVEHRKYVPSFIQTSIKTYIANMYESYLQYQKLFYFFGKGSLREKKVKSKYEDIKKICEKYKQDNEIPIAQKVTDIGKNIDSIILKYVNFFKEKKYISNHIRNIDNTSFGDLLLVMFMSLDIALVHADLNIEELKKIVLYDENRVYYADIRSCMRVVEECFDTIGILRKKFSVIISKIDFKFLQKHHSKDLSKINTTISTIYSELDIACAQLEEYYRVALDTISRVDDTVLYHSNKLGILLTSKANYLCSREKFLSIVIEKDYTISDLIYGIKGLEKDKSNLDNIVMDNVDLTSVVLDYSKAPLLKSKLLELKKTIDTSNREMDALVGTAHSAKSAIQYALSPMRKVEKVLDVVKRITGATNQCRSAIGAVQGVLNALP